MSLVEESRSIIHIKHVNSAVPMNMKLRMVVKGLGEMSSDSDLFRNPPVIVVLLTIDRV